MCYHYSSLAMALAQVNASSDEVKGVMRHVAHDVEPLPGAPSLGRGLGNPHSPCVKARCLRPMRDRNRANR